MNTDDLAKRFHVSRGTAQRWCRDGKVRGVSKNSRGEYEIPESPVLCYQPKQKKNRTAYDTYIDIVRACNKNQYVSAEELGCTDKQFRAYTQSLVAERLLKPLVGDEDQQKLSTLDFVATLKGCELARKNKAELVNFLKQLALKISI